MKRVVLFDIDVCFMQTLNYIFCKHINPGNVVMFMECDPIRLEVVLVTIYQNL